MSPVDISGELPARGERRAAGERFPGLADSADRGRLHPPVCDLPAQAIAGRARLGFFPGSTIGNIGTDAAGNRPAAGDCAMTLGDDAMLLIGMDLIKDRRKRLLAAYDDSQRASPPNSTSTLPRRINRELGGTLPARFTGAQGAVWSGERARIEMHLEATRRDIVLRGLRSIASRWRAGETIHTENSHKYSRESANLLLLAGGWEPLAHYCDADALFMVVLARAILPDMTA
jgi:L-histidine N-alpha-methyltransferase